MDYLLQYADRGFSGNPYDAGNDRAYSMDALPQELPCQGTGDFRNTAVVIRNADGSYGCDFRYQGHRIRKGKYALPGLPAVYAGEDEADTLEIDLLDETSRIEVTLFYGVLPEQNVITRSACIKNHGAGKCYLKKAQAACLDFVGGEYDLICFYGRHAMERNVQRTPVAHGTQVIGSRRGTSSHQYNPMFVLAGRGTTEDTGSCYAMSFVYSGSFKGEVEKDQFNQTRALLGLSDEMFSYPLEPGEVFFVPEVVCAYSGNGLSGLSQDLHACFRKHLCRGKYRDCVRPILLNSWEASYFDINGKNVYELARQAADLGIEMLVMDDGWFGKRDFDESGLGDWFPNEEKLGMSLHELIQGVKKKGLSFGIWMEPEMVNEDSRLYREHPDWAITLPGREPGRGRCQLVLDLGRECVREYLYQAICGILDTGDISYVKWDMNRSISDMYNPELAPEQQGEAGHRYVLGLYELLERITQRYPNVLFEGCSGGGGRFDAGMLYYSPQIWCSDDTDAIERLKIQYGTSFAYPISTVGSHVSACPNHQNGRITPLHTRGTVAMAGTFGYELDIGKMSEEDKEEVKAQVQSYKEYFDLIQGGNYYRLTKPEEIFMAWQFVSEDQTKSLVSVVMTSARANAPGCIIRCKGLNPQEKYKEAGTGKIYSGSTLMYGGYLLPKEMGEYQSYQMYFERV